MAEPEPLLGAEALRAFRAPMRSRRNDIDAAAAVERALTRGLVGVGGALAAEPATLAEAAAAVASQYDERTARRLKRFADVPDGVFVWTSDGDGLMWLGRLAGAWRYDPDPDAAALDLAHVRPCAWLPAPVGDSEVPSRVRVAFARGGRNWQEIRDEPAVAATRALWQRAQS